MTTLNDILEHKRSEVAERKELYPVKLLERSICFSSPVVSMKKYIHRGDLSGIIAEFKRRSPSMGVINAYAPVERTTIGYMQAGASALSVLTDTRFFGGKNEDLTIARKFNYCPILRKDFILDPYQVLEARSIGADAILLIAAALDRQKTLELARLARECGMEVLLEVHSQNELEHYNEYVDMIGVNNRNLKDMKISLDISENLVSKIPDGVTRVSESGLEKPADVLRLKKAGYHGFLVGGSFMKNSRPETACAEFIKKMSNG